MADRVVDIYSKGGDIGLYRSYLAVVPDYDIRFAVAIAGAGTHRWIDGLIVDIVFPALEAAAREQADATYGGTYAAADGLNSSLTLTTEAGKVGLIVKDAVSNGTDLLSVMQKLMGVTRDM